MNAPRSLPCVFMRGGTSKALMFHARDLPHDIAERNRLFLLALGSPDPYGRQLDGMGGGVSSLSKVCVMGPPSRPDVDVDYTFAQVSVKEARVNYAGNCGNMSAAVGPFCVDEGLLVRADGPAVVRIHNTNTGKIIVAHFEVREGRSVPRGDLVLPGVTGGGAPVRLDFMDPGGAATGRLLPTDAALDLFEVEGLGPVQASVVDAANLCVFVRAQDFGLTGTELPAEMEEPARAATMNQLCAIARQAQVAAGVATDLAAARAMSLPLIAWIAPAHDSVDLSGVSIPAGDVHLCVRMLSDGQPHRALPMTGAVCTAVAARITRSLVNQCATPAAGPMRLAMPSGVIQVDAEFGGEATNLRALRGSVYRSARRLFEGRVFY